MPSALLGDSVPGFGLFTAAGLPTREPVEPTIRKLEVPHGEFRAAIVDGLGENKALNAKRSVSPRCRVPTWATGYAAPIHAESTGWARRQRQAW